MSDKPTCAACTSPVGDAAVICTRCTARLEQALAETPAVVNDAQLVLSRQATRVDPLRGGQGDDDEARTLDRADLGTHVQKLPYDGGASGALTQLRAVLVFWVRFVVEQQAHAACGNECPRGTFCVRVRETDWPAQTFTGMSAHLLNKLTWLRQQPAAVDALDQIIAATSAVTAVGDRNVDRWYVGDCGAADCREAVYSLAGAVTAVCTICHTVHDVASRRATMLDAVLEMLATAEECALIAAYSGRTLKADRVRQWASRGRIVVHGVNTQGQPTYLVHEVVDLVDAADGMRDAG